MSSPEQYKQRLIYLEAIKADLVEKFNAARLANDLEQAQALTIALHQLDGKMQECDTWRQWAEAYPAIERPDQLPTTDTMPPQADNFDNAAAIREAAHAERTAELVKLLPGIGDNLNGAGRAD